jgi:SAM-dependent methyltransferase
LSIWDSPENAAAYARFCREFPMYRDTSATLADLAGLETADLVVDLACGTGVTTRAILDRLPPTGRVLALDGSEAMLAVARGEVVEPRVRWVHARAETLADHVDRPADAVVCNSAFWQMDMPAVARAASTVLRPGGMFVFNIGGEFLDMPVVDDQRSTPTLFELMCAATVLHHGFVPRLPPRRPPHSPDSIVSLLEAAGFEAEPTRIIELVHGPESDRAWLSVPAFTDRRFPGLSYEQRMDALATAYERVDRSLRRRTPWAVFVGRSPSAT